MTYRTIITRDGIYTTRGGRLAFIVGVERDASTGEARFRGYMHAIQGREVVNEWHAWRTDGRLAGSGSEHEYDVTGVV